MNIALILAGGAGVRLGADIPKQYIKINNKSIISYCLDTFVSHNNIDYIHIVADEEWHNFILSELNTDKFKGFSKPGENRQLSIYNGLVDIKKYANANDYIIVHDAVRPLVSKKLIDECLISVKGHDGVLPVLPMKDTVYLCENSKITSLIDRSEVFAGQAPEVFVLDKYYLANKNLLPKEILKINGSTEPAIIGGMDICTISGDENNFKITTRADLELFEKIVKKV